MSKATKLLFLVTEDWYFCSHRLSLAVAARDAGYDVVVATRVSRHGSDIERAGLTLVPLRKMRRSSYNIFSEISALREIIGIYRRERPSLVHQVALKPVVYGTVAARLTGFAKSVNALGGLGFVFSSEARRAKLLRPWISLLFKILLDHRESRTIVQNKHDFNLLSKNIGINETRIRRIRGAGVDMKKYAVTPLSVTAPLAVLASRMLWDKGIKEFVDAARILKSRGSNARFVLAGSPDPENPSAIPEQQLVDWHTEGCVEWWGYRADMPAVFSQAHVVCLPSYYGEGIPKVLVEAMACARAIITTDMPGCRELVEPGENGLLVPSRDAEALADALHQLLQDPSRCARMGQTGRQIAESEFASPRIISETLDIYAELLN